MAETTVCLRDWIPRVAMFLALGGSLASTWFLLPDDNTWLAIFWTVFIFRYTRLFGHLIGYWSYHASPISSKPTYNRHDCTIIVPTIDPNGPDFQECIRSVLANNPAKIILVTVGAELKAECRRVLQTLLPDAGNAVLTVTALARPSKRHQIRLVMPHVHTAITILVDDHVFFPSKNFIPSALAPFENPRVGAVATKKRVRRADHGIFSWKSIINFLAKNYLDRHNWELRASNAIDGGVFVISGRTAVYKTEFLANTELLEKLCNERLFNHFEILADDDNLFTREAMKKGYLIRFQDTEDATIETTLGQWPKFHLQLLRWARTTIRSNPVMLRDPGFLYQYTWSAVMVYWAGLVNFAILWDAALLFSLDRAVASASLPERVVAIILVVLWILATKAIKIASHLRRHPADIQLFVFQVFFSYAHSFYKLFALITF